MLHYLRVEFDGFVLVKEDVLQSKSGFDDFELYLSEVQAEGLNGTEHDVVEDRHVAAVEAHDADVAVVGQEQLQCFE